MRYYRYEKLLQEYNDNNTLERSDQEKIRMLDEKDSNKYLEILEADNIKQVEMKERN